MAVPADIGDNTGLWTALAGGRLHEDIGAPLYQGDTFHRDYIAAYGYTSPHSGSQVLNVLATDVDLVTRSLQTPQIGNARASSTRTSAVHVSSGFPHVRQAPLAVE